MSKIFGEIRQIAFIVENIDAAMKYWINALGVGPFYIKRNISFSQFEYKGKVMPSPHISIALANSGYLQIELIEQHDQAKSIYKDYLNSGQKNLQHVSSWLTTDELLEKKEELLSKGYHIAQECTLASNGVKIIYFCASDDPTDFMFEIAALKEPEQYQRVLGIRSAYDQWDGIESIIEVEK